MLKGIARFIWEMPLLLLIVALGLGLFTGQKLYKMTQIRGWVPGAQVIQKTITDTATDISTGRRGGDKVFYVAWDGQDAQVSGPNRTNVDEATYQKLWAGKEVELIKVFGDRKYYLRNGIYADNSNFTFDITIFLAEIVLLIIAVVRLLRLNQSSKVGKIKETI